MTVDTKRKLLEKLVDILLPSLDFYVKTYKNEMFRLIGLKEPIPFDEIVSLSVEFVDLVDTVFGFEVEGTTVRRIEPGEYNRIHLRMYSDDFMNVLSGKRTFYQVWASGRVQRVG